MKRLPNVVDNLQAQLRIALEDHPKDKKVFALVSKAIQKLDLLIASGKKTA